MGKIERKGKIQSINFEPEIYEALTKEVAVANSNYSSRVNELIRRTYGLDDDVKDDIARYCHDRAETLIAEADTQPEFEQTRLSSKISQYVSVVDLLTSGKGVQPRRTGSMQRIDMADGYLLCPNDWIVLDDINDPAVCSSAVVIEFRNQIKYELPHFVLFTNASNLTEQDEQNALDKAANKSKIYDKVRRMYLKPQYDSEGNLLNAREVMGQPEPGFFWVAELGTAREYPYGAMVVPSEYGAD